MQLLMQLSDTMLSNILIILCLYCASFTALSANVKKVPCSYDDEQCLSESTKAIYPIIVAGRPGEVEASDPLYLDEIAIEEPNFNVVFSKAKMSGLQGCTVKDVLVTAEKAYFIYQIWCPSITVGATYEAGGEFDGTLFEGKGTSQVTFNNYDIWIKGYYDKHIDEAGDLYTQVTNFIIDLRVEEVTRNVTGLYFGGQKSTDGASEEKLKLLEIHVRKPIMYKFLQKYIKNLNSFLKIVPIKDIHYQLVAK